jgi:arginyl-tRNA synthetase
LFKSTDYGDDRDRALKKSDGTNTYFANDIAYHFDKFKRGFSRQINIWGADHAGYVKRMVAATTAVSDNKANLHVKLCQLVKLIEGGKSIKMSKRSGNFITLRDLTNEIDIDVIRFFMLSRKADAQLDFDLDLLKQQSRSNPVFYIHYAHARCCSVLRQADSVEGDGEKKFDYLNADMSILDDDNFLPIIKELALYPKVLESAAEALEPHRVGYYLTTLAGRFHELWAKGNADDKYKFIKNDNFSGTCAKLALVYSVKQVLCSGLDIFMITAKEEL